MLATRRRSRTRPEPGVAANRSAHDAQHAARKDEDQHDQDRAQHELPVLGVARHHRIEDLVDRRADGGAGERLNAAQQHHDERLDRHRHVDVRREHAALAERERGAGESGERRGHDERDPLVEPDVDADRLGAAGVIARRAQREPERRLDDPREQRETHAARAERQVVIPDRRAEPPRGPHAEQPVVTAGDVVPLVRDRVDDLRERERQHREVDRGEPDAEKPDRDRADPGDDRRQDERHRHGRVRPSHGEGRAVGAEPERGRVAEGHHAAGAHQHVQASCEERKRQDLDEHPHPERGEHRRQDHQREHADQEPSARNLDVPSGDESPLGAALRLRATEQAPRPHDQHHRHHEEDHHERELRQDHHADRIDDADHRGGEERTRERPHAPHDDDGEGLGDDRPVHDVGDRDPRHLQRTAEPGERRAEHEHRREQARLVDAEQRDHLAVQRRRADEHAPPRAIEEPPERRRDDRADDEQREVVRREQLAADAHRSREPGRDRPGLVLGAPDEHDDIRQDQHQRERQEQLVQLGRAVHAPEQSDLDGEPDRADGESRDEDRDVERGGAERQDGGQRHREIRGEHVERAVREVHDARDAEDERQAGRDEEEHHRVREPGEELDEDECGRHPKRADATGRAASSRPRRRAAPCRPARIPSSP